jgi:hypothetical protein
MAERVSGETAMASIERSFRNKYLAVLDVKRHIRTEQNLFGSKEIDGEFERLRRESGRCRITIELAEVLNIGFGDFRGHWQPDGLQYRPIAAEPRR